MANTLVEWRDPGREVRVLVADWVTVCSVEGQYIRRGCDVRMVLAYLRRVGAKAVIRKVLSRLAERTRNRKVAGVGVGVVLEAPEGQGVTRGKTVVFFAPSVREEPASVVVDRRMVVEIDDLSRAGDETAGEQDTATCELGAYAGWSSYSGLGVDEGRIQGGLRAALVGHPGLTDALVRQAKPGTNVVAGRERQESQERPWGRPSAVLFGLGNYAKTQVLPVVRKSLDLRCIHEIDPDQILAVANPSVALDTSPFPRNEEEYDAWFVAGYHHHHAPLAVHAIRQGAYAVVEKPLATTWEQLRELEDALEGSGAGELMTCFQRRYSPMQSWAFKDLGKAEDEAVHYHCIVYEIPLPARHWYNWPNAGSRLISNGCHWIDHFMSLNDYAPATDYRVKGLGNGDITVAAELENGAAFTMLVTEHGSERLGVRDHVEARSGDVTVKMVDQAYYEAESSKRVIRRRSINPTKAYKRMYENAVGRIRRGESGDSTASLESTRLMLLLEDELGHCPGTGNAVSPGRN